MSAETLDTRRRKRVIEHRVTGFDSAQSAKTFASVLHGIVESKLGKTKMQPAVGSSLVAITEDFIGPTTLKMVWLDIPDQVASEHIRAILRSMLGEYKIEQEVVREKPQPQFINVAYIPNTSKVIGI